MHALPLQSVHSSHRRRLRCAWDRYEAFAARTAAVVGSGHRVVWLMEPDFYQYADPRTQLARRRPAGVAPADDVWKADDVWEVIVT